MLSSRGSSQPRDPTHVFCIAGGFFTIWASREAVSKYGKAVSDGIQDTLPPKNDTYWIFQAEEVWENSRNKNVPLNFPALSFSPEIKL